MELHQARYFVAACNDLNFTRVAKRCNVSQPSLTRAIQLLEQEFGGCLFDRKRSSSSFAPILRNFGAQHLQQSRSKVYSAKAPKELNLAIMCTIAPKLLPHTVGALVHEAIRTEWANKGAL